MPWSSAYTERDFYLLLLISEEKLDDKEENQIEKGEMEVINSGYTSRRFCIHILCECDKVCTFYIVNQY